MSSIIVTYIFHYVVIQLLTVREKISYKFQVILEMYKNNLLKRGCFEKTITALLFPK